MVFHSMAHNLDVCKDFYALLQPGLVFGHDSISKETQEYNPLV